MNRFSHKLLVAGLLPLCTGAAAQPPGPPPSGPGALTQHRSMDRPDMRAPMRTPPATRTDLQTALETRFAEMDANQDGKLDGQDRAARRDERVATAFGRIDANGDGAISKDEFAAAPALAGGPRPMPRRATMFAPRGPGGQQAGPMRGPQGAGGQPITKSDFVARGLARFDEADTDHDGTLSAAERDAVRGSMRDRRERAKSPASRPNPQPSGQ